MIFDLTEQEHQTLVAILSDQPWRIANPLIYKLAQQARDQSATGAGFAANYAGRRPDGEDRGIPPLQGSFDQRRT